MLSQRSAQQQQQPPNPLHFGASRKSKPRKSKPRQVPTIIKTWHEQGMTITRIERGGVVSFSFDCDGDEFDCDGDEVEFVFGGAR